MLLISIAVGLTIFIFGVLVGSEIRVRSLERLQGETRKDLISSVNSMSHSLEELNETIETQNLLGGEFDEE